MPCGWRIPGTVADTKEGSASCQEPAVQRASGPSFPWVPTKGDLGMHNTAMAHTERCSFASQTNMRVPMHGNWCKCHLLMNEADVLRNVSGFTAGKGT